MKREDLLKFVTQFNKAKPLTNSEILECLKLLPEEDHQLFIYLVNYKNGSDFVKKVSQ